ncbi:MAG: YqjF family protein [Armatimonadota bacterium]
MAIFRATIENLLLITHAVPAERVRPLVPGLELDLVKGPEGEDVALVTTTCCLVQEEGRDFGFHMSEYRTYVKGGIYVAEWFIEHGVAPDLPAAETADFDVSMAYDPSTRSYRRYYCEMLSDLGTAIIEVSSEGLPPEPSTPFATGEELARFITDRPTKWYADGTTAPIRHARMDPVEAEMLAGQFDVWEELGILREEEFEQPYSLLIQPVLEYEEG